MFPCSSSSSSSPFSPSSSSSCFFPAAMFNSTSSSSSSSCNFSLDGSTPTRLQVLLPHHHNPQDNNNNNNNNHNLCSNRSFINISNNQASIFFPNSSALLLPPPPPPPSLLPPLKSKKKRSLPGNPDPEAEVIALSPKTLMATNRFVCEICKKGFQRDQNLQLHRRGHNLPWKLKQRSHNNNNKEDAVIRKKAYVCPEPTCVHHHPSRALGDLTGIKKHYCRKHGEKKWKCEKCSKIYAVHSDWKAHSKTCGTREYRCDCGTLFSRKDSFITHRAFCDALAEESARLSAAAAAATNAPSPPPLFNISQVTQADASGWPDIQIKPDSHRFPIPSLYHCQQQPPPSPPSHHLSATALLQKAATVAAATQAAHSQMSHLDMGELGAAFRRTPGDEESAVDCVGGSLAAWRKSDRLTRDFLGLTGHEIGGREMVGYGGGVGLQGIYGGSEVAMLMKGDGFVFGDGQPPPSHGAASGTLGDC